ncbi:hypothetical protein [Paraburkholderia graminis]|uniref:Phage tail protein X n=1 Tax=Paraburkholderia graminis TaxID=60548 RepID=A0ABD5CS55_9BURK|nr:hypothetical protein [Paraburkholderia graminis]MDR6208174.1 phage tail protein X [Paraburkholderia graminis]
MDATLRSSQTSAQLDSLARRLADSLWIGVHTEVHTADEGLADQQHLIAAMREIHSTPELAAFVDSFRRYCDALGQARAADGDAFSLALLLRCQAEDAAAARALRHIAREMVHLNWRRMLTARIRTAAEVQALSAAFTEQTVDIAGWLLQPDAAVFLEEIEAERGVMSDEYARDSRALKQRLGVLGVGRQTADADHRGRASVAGAVVGEVARTSVRVTLWEVMRRAIFGR